MIHEAIELYRLIEKKKLLLEKILYKKYRGFSIVLKNTLSQYNQEYSFIYTSSGEFDKSLKKSINRFENFYHTKSLIDTDLDTGYQHLTAWNRSFYEGVKNTKYTTLDGDSPIIIRTTSPTVAVPTDSPDSNLKVFDKDI